MGLLSKVPFVTGELGEKDCTAKFIDTYMSWADAHGVSYLAWTFDSGPCDGPYLIDSSGNPTPYGAGYKAHLAVAGSTSVGDLPAVCDGLAESVRRPEQGQYGAGRADRGVPDHVAIDSPPSLGLLDLGGDQIRRTDPHEGSFEEIGDNGAGDEAGDPFCRSSGFVGDLDVLDEHLYVGATPNSLGSRSDLVERTVECIRAPFGLM